MDEKEVSALTAGGKLGSQIILRSRFHSGKYVRRELHKRRIYTFFLEWGDDWAATNDAAFKVDGGVFSVDVGEDCLRRTFTLFDAVAYRNLKTFVVRVFVDVRKY